MVNKSVHIPVLLTVGDFRETVYNDFYIGEGADVTIGAGCGIHNDACGDAEHDGIHSFYLEKNAKVKYVERHYAAGDGTGKKSFDPVTNIYCKENACFVMESTQLGGVTSTDRKTYARLGKRAQMRIGIQDDFGIFVWHMALPSSIPMRRTKFERLFAFYHITECCHTGACMPKKFQIFPKFF